jgi:hypothetical protein
MVYCFLDVSEEGAMIGSIYAVFGDMVKGVKDWWDLYWEIFSFGIPPIKFTEALI